MKRSLIAVALGAALADGASAQDFLQQWRDSATRQMHVFRANAAPGIVSAGWRFIAGSVSAESVPIADVFIARVAARTGTIRSADVLTSYYAERPESVVPAHQSARSVEWFDCAAGTWEQRSLKLYSGHDGSGEPNHAEPAKPDSEPATLGPIDHGVVTHAVLAAVCGQPL
jgi:hypothetical protein